MERLALLTAVNEREQHEEPPHWTTVAIAGRLGVSDAEAEAALRRAEHEGLVVEEHDESIGVGSDFNRQRWRLSDAGRQELYRLEDE
jgi:DNA-binding MarR family transcriptional regulator